MEQTGARGENKVARVLALGAAQIVGWGSSTYLPAVIAAPASKDLGLSPGMFFGAFSLALVTMACAGPAIGRYIDRNGGRRVLLSSNFVLAAGLLLLSQASGGIALYAAWCVMGLGMAMGLYDAIFAALVAQHAKAASRLIVGVSLVGGFASTVGWPASTWVIEHWGWRSCCQAWAVAHLLIAAPVYWRLVPPGRAEPSIKPAAHPSASANAAMPPGSRARELGLLCIFSGATAFVTSAMAVHLPALLLAKGATFGQAVFAGVLLGPAQVVARLVEFGLTQRLKIHPLTTARLATALHPVACVSLGLFGMASGSGPLFSVLHGAGNGMISVARGVLPLALFGASGYGAVTGRLAVFGRTAQAFAPIAFALVLTQYGPGAALCLSGALSMVALLALLRLRSGPIHAR
ncbi:MFS transporter [Cupriavidus basilensis]|uniref:Putative membrane protein n=1 Tax=Cupriavidus basilensis TaxID=68895 RepID=A0A0C4YBH1_9BURK|nr:MFS transporter [Cupriavidus basilensis]AJG22937.1 putative membrane protein [Cupriavidus basilensis]